MKKPVITRVTLEEARKMPRLTRDDLTPAEQQEYDDIRDEDIDLTDMHELDDSFFENAQVQSPGPKKSIHMRVDADIFDHFKAQGAGHLTRMHKVLRAYVDAQKNSKMDAAE